MERVQRERPVPKRSWMPIAWLVPALAAAGVLFMVRPKSSDEFQARGGAAQAQVGVSAFCIQGDAIARLEDGGRCPVGARLKLAVTNKGDYSHLFLFGVQGSEVKWYAPLPPEHESVKIQSGIVESPLPGAVELKVNHKPGPLSIRAVFSHGPLDADSIVHVEGKNEARDRVMRTLKVELTP
jgi:hypothetical protein